MSIVFSCSCGKRFRASEQAAGKRIKCSQCGGSVVVPQPESAEEPHSAWEEPAPSKHAEPDFADAAKQRARQRYADLPPEKPARSVLEYGYWLLLLAFIPLALNLLQERKEDTFERLLRSLEKAAPAKDEKTAKKQKPAAKGQKAIPASVDEPALPEVNWEELIAHLPGNRIEGALLARHSFWHWFYALLAGSGFLLLALIALPGTKQPLHLLGIGLFTATVGILLLLLAQLLAGWTQGYLLISRNLVFMLLFWIAWAIGFSYRAALDPEVGLAASFLGFTFGVGFCEEVCKLLPLLWYYRVKGTLPWRTACTWGFVSGVGFGISEGITYAADFYNGVASGEIYLVRFISCVALHGIWSASAALFLHKYPHIIQAKVVWYELIPRALFLVGISMILHGLYDTFLKKELNVLALLTALVSFAWFAWSVERTRRAEESPQLALGRT